MNKLRFLVFSDLHAHNYLEFGTWLDSGITTRMDRIIEALKKVCDYAIKKKIKNIFFTGDLFHQRVSLSVAVSNKLFKCINEYAKQDITFVLCPGNHDFISKSESGHSLEKYSKLENIFVLDGIHSLNINEFRIMGIPATNDKEKLQKRLKKLKIVRPAILLLHTHITGSLTSKGYEFKDSFPISVISKKFSATFVGDIHKFQIFKKNVIIPGALLQHNFSDVKCKKYFLDVSVDKFGIRRIKRINSKMPHFNEIRLSSNEFISLAPDDYNYSRFISGKIIQEKEKEFKEKAYELGLWQSLKSAASYFEGNYKDALEIGLKAVKLLAGFPLNSCYGRAQLVVSQSYSAVGDLKNAEIRARDALAAYRRGADRVGQSDALNELARVCYIRTNYKAVLEHLEQALELIGDNPRKRAQMTGNLGRIQLRLGNWTKAEQKLSETLKYFEEKNHCQHL